MNYNKAFGDLRSLIERKGSNLHQHNFTSFVKDIADIVCFVPPEEFQFKMQPYIKSKVKPPSSPLFLTNYQLMLYNQLIDLPGINLISISDTIKGEGILKNIESLYLSPYYSFHNHLEEVGSFDFKELDYLRICGCSFNDFPVANGVQLVRNFPLTLPDEIEISLVSLFNSDLVNAFVDRLVEQKVPKIKFIVSKIEDFNSILLYHDKCESYIEVKSKTPYTKEESAFIKLYDVDINLNDGLFASLPESLRCKL